MSEASPFTRLFLRMWPALFGSILVFGAVWAEYWFFPVVRDFSVTSIERQHTAQGQVLILSGTLRKVRDCKLLGSDAEGNTAAGRIDLPLKFLDVTNDDARSRPVGAGQWGPWRVEIPIAPNVNSITLQAAHRCHVFWTSETNLITFPAGAP